MKVFKIFEPISEVLLKTLGILDKFGFTVGEIKKYSHPQEDYFEISKKFSIFAVADGVTLEYSGGKYPNPSGAGEVAKIFCESVIKEAEKLYSKFVVSDIKKVFSKANFDVEKYNIKQGRVKNKINYWDFDLFAATAAFVIIKNDYVYWASMCDSSVTHFNKSGKLKFSSPECWQDLRKNLPANWDEIPECERRKEIRKTYRNGIDKKCNLIGYGVVTGEEIAEKYLNFGKFPIESGDIVVVLTDGFENYIKLPEFIDMFKKWPEDLKKQVESFTAKKSLDNPKKFGHERTLIAVKI
jgi:serine/threonine protein phosphatase PrpC